MPYRSIHSDSPSVGILADAMSKKKKQHARNPRPLARGSICPPAACAPPLADRFGVPCRTPHLLLRCLMALRRELHAEALHQGRAAKYLPSHRTDTYGKRRQAGLSKHAMPPP